jgi:hypothetical protein
MPIVKRRLDICGRERTWDYVVESSGDRYDVRVQQLGHGEPEFQCSCGSEAGVGREIPSLFEAFQPVCVHISEVQRDLHIARQAAAQMVP